VPAALRFAQQALTARLRRGLRREGLPFSRYVILRNLVVRGPATSKALAEKLGVTTANMPGLIGRLEADGWVRRARNPKDRREILIGVTARGRRGFLRLKEGAVRELLAAFEEWPDEDLRRLLQLLRRFSGGPPADDLVRLRVLR
jgi:DNA-binding MarR family transcriptional regulator